jgi:hypothetical protein
MHTFFEDRRVRAPGTLLRWASVALAVTLLSACGGSNGPTSIPRLAVSFARTPVPIALNGHCWQTQNHGRCADPTPIQSEILARGLDAIRVLPDSQGQVAFDHYPDVLNLTAGLDEAHLEPVLTSRGSFRAPSAPGRYDFHLSGRWHEGEASWVFVVTVSKP